MPPLSAYCLTWVSLTLEWGVSLQLFQQSAATAPDLGRGVAPLGRTFRYVDKKSRIPKERGVWGF